MPNRAVAIVKVELAGPLWLLLGRSVSLRRKLNPVAEVGITRQAWKSYTISEVPGQPTESGVSRRYRLCPETLLAERQRVNRRLRQRGGIAPRLVCSRPRPRDEWIEIIIVHRTHHAHPVRARPGSPGPLCQHE